jgi:hypothetical protein
MRMSSHLVQDDYQYVSRGVKRIIEPAAARPETAIDPRPAPSAKQLTCAGRYEIDAVPCLPRPSGPMALTFRTHYDHWATPLDPR